MTTKISQWLQDSKKDVIGQRGWFIYNKSLDVYLRLTIRNGLYTIDIANVSVINELKQSKGIFKEFVHYMAGLAIENGYEALYFENVINQRLMGKFEKCWIKDKSSWKRDTDLGDIRSYTYFLGKNKTLDF